MSKLVLQLFLVLLLSTTGAWGANSGPDVNFGDEPGNASNQFKTVTISDQTSGVTLIEQTNDYLTLRIDIGEVYFAPVQTREGVFTLMSVADFARNQNIGEPDLPLANRLISIPFGCEPKAAVIGYETAEIDLADLGIDALLMPVQPSLSKSDDPGSVPFEFDRGVYDAPGGYRLPMARAEAIGIMRADRVGLVSVSPFEYSPSDDIITVHTAITVRVEFEGADWVTTEAMQRRYYSPVYGPARDMIINSAYTAGNAKTDLVKYPIKYAIIADRMFEAQLASFIEWKTRKGFDVVVGYTDVIGTSTTAIKSYIQGLYNAGTAEDPAPSFVLFVGDAQQIPTFSGNAGSHVTDLYYCEFTGDDLPEIYYGRFSAQNTAQLQPQIDKTLEYEQYLMPDPSYLGDITLVSGVDSYYAATHGNGQINYGTTYYFNAAHGIAPNVWLYPASDGSGASGDIIQTISDGVGFYNYTAHCDHDGPQNPPFRSSDIAGLNNTHEYLLGIGNCCLSNTFGSNYSTPCFGETWLQAQDEGGIGWIGGSNSTYWNEDYYWGVGNGPIDGDGPSYEETGLGAYDGVFHDHGEAVSDHHITNYAVVFRGNMAVTESGSSRTQYYWEIYHLMGDPSVMTYFGVPDANNVNHAASIPVGATSFSVQADAGSYVGISSGGVLHGAAYVDASGTVDVPLDPFGSPTTAEIVVTCQNVVPYSVSVDVVGDVPPVADFVGSPTSGQYPLTVTFTDQSTGAPTSWSWDFGDGVGTSTQQNPSYTYNAEGSYTVTLTATNTYGTDDEVKTNYITVTAPAPPVAAFVGLPTSGEYPLTVDFTDQSSGNPTTWSWDFGDGVGTSTEQNPSYTYDAVGTYTVTLTVTSAYGSDTETKLDYINVTEQSQSVKAYANADLPVAVTLTGDYTSTYASDNSYEVVTEVVYDNHPRKRSSYLEHKWTVDLGSGGSDMMFYLEGYRPANSEGDNFIFAYSTDNNTFVDMLTVASATEQVYSYSMPAGLTGTVYIRVVDTDRSWYNTAFDAVYVDEMYIEYGGGQPSPPVAEFSGSPTSGSYPLTVNFTDISTGAPTTWSWDFGDGVGTSTAQNPSYTYNSMGTYTVSMTATNAYGSDTETKTGYITVTDQAQGYIYVSNMVVGRRKVGPNYLGTCTVTIRDDVNGAVSGAVVYVTATGPTGGTFSGTTAADGTVYFETSSIKRPSGEWCFEVTNVTHSTLDYDAASNVVTKACESGVVYRLNNDLAKALPDQFELSQNHPNPFNPVTQITFALPVPGHVTLEVFNITGQRVTVIADRQFGGGYHTLTWDGSGQASGVYFYRLQYDSVVETRKMVLMK